MERAVAGSVLAFGLVCVLFFNKKKEKKEGWINKVGLLLESSQDYYDASFHMEGIGQLNK
jgi:hypothetical protein